MEKTTAIITKKESKNKNKKKKTNQEIPSTDEQETKQSTRQGLNVTQVLKSSEQEFNILIGKLEANR